MSYIALYRKHRPQKFSDVINQEHIKKTLINALVHDKVAHAYLFSGPRGVGKTTIGRLLAKAVNCAEINGNTGEACNKWSNCKEISTEKTVDITEIDAASNRGIDEIRELREKIKYMPSKLNYRVFIIDEVHMLTIEAFNALLKTLEEPPAHIIFILATTEPQKIPPTILSRCQRFDFKKIGIEEIMGHLEKISKKEDIKIDKEGLKMIAQNADGSSRDALSLLGQVQSAFNKKNIIAQDIIDLLGLASDQMIYDITEQILEKNIKQSLEMANELIMRGYDPSLLLDSIVEFLRKLLLLKNTEDNNLFLATKDEQEKINSLLNKIDNKEILSLINYLIEGKNILKYSPLSQLPLEMAIIKYINPDDSDVNTSKNNNELNSSKSKNPEKENISSMLNINEAKTKNQTAS
jgi:DNA polymerase-3 subunit gamma/tau